ncbi:MAG: hypothetical protein AB7O97_19705 [Planctomycetota bacterium]
MTIRSFQLGLRVTAALLPLAALPAQQLLRDVRPGAASRVLAAAEPLGVLGAVALFAAVGDVDEGRLLWRSDGTDAGTWPVLPLDAIGAATFAWNGAVYFFGGPRHQQPGLWRTDGTAAGTLLVRGGLEAVPALRAFEPGPGGLLYFVARDAARGAELWRTDGTGAGTDVVVDLVPGPGDGVPGLLPPPVPTELRAAAGLLFFPGRTADTAPFRLWRTDGTASGTAPVSAGAGGAQPLRMEAVNGLLVYCVAGPGAVDGSLWRTDGTAAGTAALLSDRAITDHAVVGARYAFVTVSPLGDELFATDGAGLWLVADVRSGAAGSVPLLLGSAGGQLFFAADDGVFGRELWRTDGSPGSADLVADLTPGASGAAFAPLGARPGSLWFAMTAAGFGLEPWRVDPVTLVVEPVGDLRPGPEPSTPRSAVALGSGMLLVADDGTGDARPFASDGTPAGTAPLRPLRPAASSPRDFASSRGLAFFTADDGVVGREPWVSDGTPGGTARLADTVPGPTGLPAARFVAFADATWFTAGGGLWRSDGTPAGTRLEVPGTFGVELTAAGDALYLTTANALLRSDGTAAGTATLLALNVAPTALTAMGDQLVFAAADPLLLRVFRTDGSAAGTTEVFRAGGNPPVLLDVAADADHVWFAWRATLGVPPLVLPLAGLTVVLPAGTGATVRTVSSGLSLTALAPLGAVGGECVFVDGGSGEPWRTDGLNPPSPLADLAPGAGRSEPDLLTRADDLLYFTASDGARRRLWRTDGTPAGTLPLDAASAPAIATPTGLLAAGDGRHLVFDAADAAGIEPWITDGTLQGTRRLVDAFAGPRSGWPLPRGGAGPVGAVAGARLVLALDDGASGAEPFALPLVGTAAVLARVFGAPCGHPGGSRPHIGTDGLPRLGNGGFAFTLRDAAPGVVCGMALRVGRLAVPTPIGCTVQVDQFALPLAVTDAAGAARLPAPVPNDPFLLGAELTAQFVAADPPAGPIQFALSDSLTLLLGR